MTRDDRPITVYRTAERDTRHGEPEVTIEWFEAGRRAGITEAAESRREYAAAWRSKNGQVIPYGHEVLDREYAEREVAEVNAQEREAGVEEDPMFLATRSLSPWRPVQEDDR